MTQSTLNHQNIHHGNIGIILWIRCDSERRHCIVTSSLIGLAHSQNALWNNLTHWGQVTHIYALVTYAIIDSDQAYRLFGTESLSETMLDNYRLDLWEQISVKLKAKQIPLSHWGCVTHICICKLIIIVSDNGLSPDRRQAIIWTIAGLLSIGPLRTYFSESLIKIQQFSLKKMHLKMLSAKWRPSCLGLNVLKKMRLVCRMAAILSQPHCVNSVHLQWHLGVGHHHFRWLLGALLSPFTRVWITEDIPSIRHWETNSYQI